MLQFVDAETGKIYKVEIQGEGVSKVKPEADLVIEVTPSGKEDEELISIQEETTNEEAKASSEGNEEVTESKKETEGLKFFSHEATLQLIEEYSTIRPLFEYGGRTKFELWKVVKEKLSLMGYEFTAVQCQQRWSRLLKTYNTIKRRKTHNSRRAWPYFKIVDQVVKKYNILNVAIASSSALSKSRSLATKFSLESSSDIEWEFRDAEPPKQEDIEVNEGPFEDNASEDDSTSIWPNEAVLLLLKEYRDMEPSLLQGTLSRKQLWENVKASLDIFGHKVSSNACQAKWEWLVRTYRQMKYDNSMNSRARRKEWPYFTIMDELLKSHPLQAASTSNDSMRLGTKRSASGSSSDQDERPRLPDFRPRMECSEIMAFVENENKKLRDLLISNQESTIEFRNKLINLLEKVIEKM